MQGGHCRGKWLSGADTYGYTGNVRFVVELEPGEDGWMVVSCPALPGCHSQGRTREEALANIQEAIAAWLEAEELEAESALFASDGHTAVVEVAA